MRHRLWDLESRKVIISNNVYFNKCKFHGGKQKKVEKIRRVIFQEYGQGTNIASKSSRENQE